ncbi:MAG TPA: hypothetical protein VJV79_31600 [Polyangiaceae bacterium]|nr:hypothetical protein [Polyangiaceae bacterium]
MGLSVDNTSGITAPSALPINAGDGFEYLTGESLLMYCQTRLQDLDVDIQTRMDDQKSALTRRQVIQTAEQAFKMFGDKGPQSQAEWGQCEDALAAAVNALPPGDPGRAMLSSFCEDLHRQYCENVAPNPHYPHDGEWKGTIDGLVKMQENIKSGSEIEMLQLQQLMSQRQTAVQLTTNMMSKMDQALDAIVKNV